MHWNNGGMLFWMLGAMCTAHTVPSHSLSTENKNKSYREKECSKIIVVWDGAVVLINKKNCILNQAVCLRRIVCLTVSPIRGVCSGLIAVLAELFEKPERDRPTNSANTRRAAYYFHNFAVVQNAPGATSETNAALRFAY